MIDAFLKERLDINYFPRIIECQTCNLQYKCYCLHNSFHYFCLGCGRQSLINHPSYKEKIIRNYCVEYETHLEWYRDAELHNETGPAVEFFTKNQNNAFKNLWYINGKRVIVFSQAEFEKSKEYKEFKLRIFS